MRLADFGFCCEMIAASVPATNISSVEEPEYPLQDYMIACSDGPMVQFRPRKDGDLGVGGKEEVF